MTDRTVRLHRVFATTPEKIYRAFTDADAFARWLPPNGFTGHVYEMDAKIGGGFRMSFTNFTSGSSHGFRGDYLELTPNERVRYTTVFDDPNFPGTMHVTITIRQVSCGTDVTFVQEGIPELIPLDGCYLGWQESLRNLQRLVEPNIPG